MCFGNCCLVRVEGLEDLRKVKISEAVVNKFCHNRFAEWCAFEVSTQLQWYRIQLARVALAPYFEPPQFRIDVCCFFPKILRMGRDDCPEIRPIVLAKPKSEHSTAPVDPPDPSVEIVLEAL